MPLNRVRNTYINVFRRTIGLYKSALDYTYSKLVPLEPAQAPGIIERPDDAERPDRVRPRPSNRPSRPKFDIPDRPPRNRIRRPPIRIYDPDVDPSLRIIFPELPERIIPEAEESQERRVTSNVRQSLADRKFGCLLANPLFDAELEFCYYEDVDSPTFFGQLIDKILQILDEILDEALSEVEETVSEKINNACKLAVALFPVNFVQKSILIIGCDIFSDITKYYDRLNLALGSYPISGKINVGGVRFVKCEIPELEEETEDFTLDLVFPECAIPLSAYNDIKGYKIDQLQVIFRSSNWDNDKKKKYFSLPNPKRGLTPDTIKGIIPASWTSGKTQVDIFMRLSNVPDGIKPIYKTTIFTRHNNTQQVEDFVYSQFQQWVEGLCENVNINNYQAKFHDYIDIFEGTFNPHRAVQLGWDKDKKQWCRKAHWKIN